MPFRLLLLAGACALAPVFAHAFDSARAPLSIELRPSALIGHTRITLADVARVAAVPLAGDIGVIELGNAPRVGYTERLTREQIEHALRRRLNLGPGALAWSGAASVAVRVQSQTVRSHELAAAATEAVARRHQSASGKLSAAVATAPADIDVPSGVITIRARPLAPGAVAARIPVWLDLAVDGVAYRSVVVPVSVTLREQAYVALRALQPGALASATDFAIAEVDVAGVQALPVGAGGARFRLRAALKAGQVLGSNALVPNGKVLPGDQVRLSVREGQIGIETEAVAVAEAEPGQLLAVRPRGGSDIVTGRLSQAGIVNIE